MHTVEDELGVQAIMLFKHLLSKIELLRPGSNTFLYQ